MNESKEINEMDVEICLEIARQFDTEDMTHPPYRTETPTAPDKFMLGPDSDEWDVEVAGDE